MSQLVFKLFNDMARKAMVKNMKKNHRFECYCCKEVWPNKSKVKVAPGIYFDEWCYLKILNEGI